MSAVLRKLLFVLAFYTFFFALPAFAASLATGDATLDRYDNLFAAAGEKHGFPDIRYAKTIAWWESNQKLDPRAVSSDSPCGGSGLDSKSIGIFQVTRGCGEASEYTVEQLMDPAINIDVGVKHLTSIYRDMQQAHPGCTERQYMSMVGAGWVQSYGTIDGCGIFSDPRQQIYAETVGGKYNDWYGGEKPVVTASASPAIPAAPASSAAPTAPSTDQPRGTSRQRGPRQAGTQPRSGSSRRQPATSTPSASTSMPTATANQCRASANAPQTSNHYIIADAEDFGEVSALGFNVLSLETPEAIAALPAGAKGIAQVGECNGVTDAWKRRITNYSSRDTGGKILAYYISDEPEPGNCDPAKLKAQADWIHANIPGAKTFGVLFGPSEDYAAYAKSFDYVGLSPYPCRGGGACDYSYITSEAERIISEGGISRDRIVPIYQSFGMPDGDNPRAQLNNIDHAQSLATWAKIAPNPPFEYVWTWKRINAQLSLMDAADQQAFFKAHNTGSCTTVATAPQTTPTVTTGRRQTGQSRKPATAGQTPVTPAEENIATPKVECEGATKAEKAAWIGAAGKKNWDFSCPKESTTTAPTTASVGTTIQAGMDVAGKGKLIYSDEFDSAALGEEWHVFDAWGTGKWRDATYDAEHYKLDGGKLTLTGEVNADGTISTSYLQGYDQANMDAPGALKFGPGTIVEASIDMSGCGDVGSATWCAFWLFDPSDPYDGNPANGTEIDIVERSSANPWSDTRYTAGNHYAKGTNSGSSNEWIDAVDPSKPGFHTYAVDWQKDKITYSVDGQNVYEVTEGVSGSDNQAVILSIESAIGGNSPWAPGTSNNSDAEMVVDYVRAYSTE